MYADCTASACSILRRLTRIRGGLLEQVKRCHGTLLPCNAWLSMAQSPASVMVVGLRRVPARHMLYTVPDGDGGEATGLGGEEAGGLLAGDAGEWAGEGAALRGEDELPVGSVVFEPGDVLFMEEGEVLLAAIGTAGGVVATAAVAAAWWRDAVTAAPELCMQCSQSPKAAP